MFKTVLFPIDRSREARQAAETVVQLVQTHSSKLYILAVVEDDNESMASPESVDQLLAEAQTSFAEAGVKAEVLERSGKPAFTICDVADEINAEVIVMGSRGLQPESAADSVTQRVLSLSPCPVLVVP
jgi:nucleotide-binding universal stress UspA family protein